MAGTIAEEARPIRESSIVPWPPRSPEHCRRWSRHEAIDQVARQRATLDKELDTQRASLRRLNQSLAREAADTSVDSGARFDRIVALQREIEGTERCLTELSAERKTCDENGINACDLQQELGSSSSTRD